MLQRVSIAQEMKERIAGNSFAIHDEKDLTPLMERIGDARIVMLGESSHGTHEYYTWRSRLSRRLITEKGFNFIAVEGDWPDCYLINRYIKGYTNEKGAADVLRSFSRWPTWMWANWEIVALCEWLRQHNTPLPADRRVGFYGLDIYSLWESMRTIIDYLQKVDPDAMKMAEQAFRCFEPYRDENGYNYAMALRFAPELCEKEIMKLLRHVQKHRQYYDHDPEAAFSAEQNARVAVNAEAYYRSMLAGGTASWNARDTHMQDTLEQLLSFHGHNSKAIVWAHNTHIGDAHFTDMRRDGMYNIGELSRSAFGNEQVVLVGFGCYKGSVIAGRRWGAPMEEMEVPEAPPGSWEHGLYHYFDDDRLVLMNNMQDTPLAEKSQPHRAIGVVYDPAREKYGNYVPSVIAKRYDAFIFFRETRALHPLPVTVTDTVQVPETYPFGV
ncbi:MAG TPA: erythromycin esterase family protein [Sediminibacterium sp.]